MCLSNRRRKEVDLAWKDSTPGTYVWPAGRTGPALRHRNMATMAGYTIELTNAGHVKRNWTKQLGEDEAKSVREPEASSTGPDDGCFHPYPRMFGLPVCKSSWCLDQLLGPGLQEQNNNCQNSHDKNHAFQGRPLDLHQSPSCVILVSGILAGLH